MGSHPETLDHTIDRLRLRAPAYALGARAVLNERFSRENKEFALLCGTSASKSRLPPNKRRAERSGGRQ
jgi:hypothetical protein